MVSKNIYEDYFSIARQKLKLQSSIKVKERTFYI